MTIEDEESQGFGVGGSPRYAFDRQLKFLSPPGRSRDDASLWREVFAQGGRVTRVYQLEPWTFVEYPSVEEADAAFRVMKEKNVVGPLCRTRELARALQGLKPFVENFNRERPPAFHKQLKLLSKELEDEDDEEVKALFHSSGQVTGVSRMGPWTFVQFRSPDKARAAFISMKQLNEGPPSLRETFELVDWLGPLVSSHILKHAYYRQIKFETSFNPDWTIAQIKKIFEAGGTVTKVFQLGRWTFIEYPTVEEAEAAYNIIVHKTEVKMMSRTDELVDALRAKRRTRQLRLPKSTESDEEILLKCRSPDEVAIGVYTSWNWSFVEFASPEAAESAFQHLQGNLAFSELRRTSELKMWVAKNASRCKKSDSTACRNAECQVKFKTTENASKMATHEDVKNHFRKSGDVVDVFDKGHFTFVQFPTHSDALNAYQSAKRLKDVVELQPTKELLMAVQGLPSIFEE